MKAPLLLTLLSACLFGQGAAPASLEIRYATYFGGSGTETASAVVLDSAGNIYLVGSTTSTDLPGTAHSFQPTKAQGLPRNMDAFIAKLDPTGTHLLWATYLGGDGDDAPTSAAVDSFGNVFVAGTTTSSNFPGTALYTDITNSVNSFVSKISADGTRLLYSVFMPATTASGITVDAAGETYIVGIYWGSFPANFVTPGALNSETLYARPMTPFVMQLGSAGSRNFVALIGGGGFNEPFATAVRLDALGNAYVAGYTANDSLLTNPGTLQPNYSNQGICCTSFPSLYNGLISKVSADGSTLVFGTYFGPKYYYTGVNDVVLDSGGSAYLLGFTDATSLATTLGSFQATSGPGFLMRLSPAGSSIQALSYLPGEAFKGAITNDGRLHVLTCDNVELVLNLRIGCTNGKYMQLTQPNLGFVQSFPMSSLPVGTYRSNPQEFLPASMAVSSSSSVWIFGVGGNIDGFTKPNTLQKTNAGSNAVLIQLGPPQPTISAVQDAASFAAGPYSPGQLVSIFGSDLGPASGLGAQLNGNTVTSALGGTTVLFNALSAPITYASWGQVNTVIPFEFSGSASTQVTVQYAGATSNSITLPLQQSAPGIFALTGTGQGQGAVLNQDFSINGANNPAARGSVISIYATGAGQTLPLAVDGMLASGASSLFLPVTVGIANSGVEVLYAGAAPGLIEGVIQINARVPADAPVGPAVPLAIKIGDAFSQAQVTVAIK